MARWRIAVGAGIVAVLAAVTAFVVASTLRGEPEVVATEPVAAAPSPSPTADPDPMPELHNTGEDFDRIYRSIEDFRNWLFRNPDPELVERIYHPECECLPETRRRLQLLIDKELRFASNETVVREVSVLDDAPATVSLKVVKQQLEQVVVNVQDGTVVDANPTSDVDAYRFLLVRGDGQQWLVRDIAEIPPGLESSSRVSEGK